MACIEKDKILLKFWQGILLAGFEGEPLFGPLGWGNRDDRHPILFEVNDDLAGEGFLEKLTGAAHRSDLVALSTDDLRHACLGRKADPPTKRGTAENAHGATITVSVAVSRRACGSSGIDESIGLNPNAFLRRFCDDGFDSISILLHLLDPSGEMDGDALLKKESLNQWLHCCHIVERGMAMAWKFYPLMEGILIDELKEVAASHGDHLFCSGKAAIVPHNPSHQTGSEQHVGPFDQKNFSALFLGRDRASTTRPATSCNDHLHELPSDQD